MVAKYDCDDMMVPWKALNGTHMRTAQCTVHLGSGMEETAISGKGGEGSQHSIFQSIWALPGDDDLLKYLTRVILEADNNWPAVVKNLAQARKVWSRMSHIISREGAALRVPGIFLKAVVQAVLLFGAETWDGRG